MKKDEQYKSPSDDRLGDLIGRIPYDLPDAALTRRIMARLGPPYSAGRFHRLIARALTPMTISFTPLAASVAALVICLAGVLIYHQLPIRQKPFLASESGGLVPVELQFKDDTAGAVAVMGSFNDWDPDGYQMTRDPRTGRWTIVIHLKPGKHDYVFLLDNQKTAPDPHADLNYRDEFGNRNSVLFVKGNHENSI